MRQRGVKMGIAEDWQLEKEPKAGARSIWASITAGSDKPRNLQRIQQLTRYKMKHIPPAHG
jgi:hypothetical protein